MLLTVRLGKPRCVGVCEFARVLLVTALPCRNEVHVTYHPWQNLRRCLGRRAHPPNPSAHITLPAHHNHSSPTIPGVLRVQTVLTRRARHTPPPVARRAHPFSKLKLALASQHRASTHGPRTRRVRLCIAEQLESLDRRPAPRNARRDNGKRVPRATHAVRRVQRATIPLLRAPIRTSAAPIAMLARQRRQPAAAKAARATQGRTRPRRAQTPTEAPAAYLHHTCYYGAHAARPVRASHLRNRPRCRIRADASARSWGAAPLWASAAAPQNGAIGACVRRASGRAVPQAGAVLRVPAGWVGAIAQGVGGRRSDGFLRYARPRHGICLEVSSDCGPLGAFRGLLS